MKRFITEGKFKVEYLKIMDEVNSKKYSVIITKRNKPIAKLMPLEETENQIFGKMRGTAHVIGDIVGPIGKDWDVTL